MRIFKLFLLLTMTIVCFALSMSMFYLLYTMVFPKPVFTAEGIQHIEESIRHEWSNREGVKVIDVNMMRESERKLIGLARLKIDGLKGEIAKDCTANMSDDGKNTVWSCR